MIEVSGIEIREDPNESRDGVGTSWIVVGGRKLHLWQIEIDSRHGVTRVYRDREEMRARTALLAQEARENG